ncbi:melanocortin-2 receptor accessory protein isoform X2 [Protopterus annectens]|uniref:melanocortin-2 receptor accessory protein isoform X2 n=1 Tax=Protopterus annectens TaxID=7888 RepID=UPI001CFA349E|nr:melanocortin-2 receptor accessory protein isoform X2 [Protopterus annectens]
MTNTTNLSGYILAYEYYDDYIDFPAVDERTLIVHKYSIAIALWSGLAVFVILLFLMLLYVSRSESPLEQNANCQWICQRCHMDIMSCLRKHDSHTSSAVHLPLPMNRRDDCVDANQDHQGQNSTSDWSAANRCLPCEDETKCV